MRGRAAASWKYRLGAWLVVCCTSMAAAAKPPSEPRPPEPTTVNQGTIVFTIHDAKGDRVPCRIHLRDASGESIEPRGVPYWHDHFVCDGRVEIPGLKPGVYHYAVEHGPEFPRVASKVTLPDTRNARAVLDVRLDRVIDLNHLGWYSGDLHIHRPVEQIEALMAAEELNIAPVITWWNDTNLWSQRPIPADTSYLPLPTRWYDVMAGEDERGGGALLYFHLPKPLPITPAKRESPSSIVFLDGARRASDRVHVDIEKPFWKDAPAWIAFGMTHSIGIAHNHMHRSGVLGNEAWGKPRPAQRFPGVAGNGLWTQEIYYHLLNAGIRIPPSAGSASGVLPNPVGYNRVYVHLSKFDPSEWWRELRRGRSFVTNGPILLVTAQGLVPGATFEIAAPTTLELDVTLLSFDPIQELEVIRDGVSVAKIPVPTEPNRESRLREFHGRFALRVDQAGWFLVRAIADVPETFRFASTAPSYVETAVQTRRISRRSVEFFLNWQTERLRELSESKLLTDPAERAAVLALHEQSRQFWLSMLSRVTGD